MKKGLTRTEARENVFLLLFQSSYNEAADREETLALSAENLEIETDGYAQRVYNGVLNSLPELDAYIEKSSKNWHKNRISRVASACIRLAIYEMLNESDVTPPVAISQAVGLAKKYGDAETASFVNGLLGGVYRSNPDKFGPAPAVKTDTQADGNA